MLHFQTATDSNKHAGSSFHTVSNSLHCPHFWRNHFCSVTVFLCPKFNFKHWELWDLQQNVEPLMRKHSIKQPWPIPNSFRLSSKRLQAFFTWGNAHLHYLRFKRYKIRTFPRATWRKLHIYIHFQPSALHIHCIPYPIHQFTAFQRFRHRIWDGVVRSFLKPLFSALFSICSCCIWLDSFRSARLLNSSSFNALAAFISDSCYSFEVITTGSFSLFLLFNSFYSLFSLLAAVPVLI